MIMRAERERYGDELGAPPVVALVGRCWVTRVRVWCNGCEWGRWDVARARDVYASQCRLAELKTRVPRVLLGDDDVDTCRAMTAVSRAKFADVSGGQLVQL